MLSISPKRQETLSLSHFSALVIFALIVSTVFAIITKQDPREQIRYGVFVFLSFLAVALAVGWIMLNHSAFIEDE